MRESVDDIRERVGKAQRNYAKNMISIESVLKSERGYVTRKPIEEDVVVILSGGLDSSVMVDMVIDRWDAIVHPLFVRRGQRACAYEEEAFDFFADFYSKRFPNNVGEPSKLDMKIPPDQYKQEFAPSLSQTIGHPMRNSTMQNMAVMYAMALNGKYDLDIKTILTGAVADDNTEPEQGLLSLRSQTLNTCISMGDWLWQVTSPLIDPYLVERPISKAGLIRYAIDQGIPLERTRTCFGPYGEADGTCFACRKRLHAFVVAGEADPILYGGRK